MSIKLIGHSLQPNQEYPNGSECQGPIPARIWVVFKKCSILHLLNSIGLASHLQCSNYELPFDQKNLKFLSKLVEQNLGYD